MPVRAIYLVRHGQYESYAEKNDPLGGALTDLGREQAHITGEALSYLPVNAIHSSTLRRAAQTADIIVGSLDGLETQSCRELWEIVPCIPPREADYFALHFPNLTPAAIARDRYVADQAFDRLFCPAPENDETDIIVCHGNIIRYFVCRVLNVPIETWANMEMNNCGITRCVIESDGRMMLVSLNDTGHLAPAMRTFS